MRDLNYDKDSDRTDLQRVRNQAKDENVDQRSHDNALVRQKGNQGGLRLLVRKKHGLLGEKVRDYGGGEEQGGNFCPQHGEGRLACDQPSEQYGRADGRRGDEVVGHRDEISVDFLHDSGGHPDQTEKNDTGDGNYDTEHVVGTLLFSFAAISRLCEGKHYDCAEGNDRGND